MDLAGQVLARPEYHHAPRVFVIVDNGSDHRGQAAISRLARAHPNAIMIHTPLHASWLNQIEIFFSVIQKKVVTPNDFASLGGLSATLLGFADRYNQTARHSAGNSPQQTCTTSWTASAATSSKNPLKTNRYRRPHDHTRRTSRATHLRSGPVRWAVRMVSVAVRADRRMKPAGTDT